ncbi:MAG: hypothetical protein ABJB17_05150, partial [Burkholderiales bacterium]
GVASMVVLDDSEAAGAVADLLSYLPSNHLDEPPFWPTDDPADHARIAQLERRLGHSAGACVCLALPLPRRSLEDAMDSHECAICRLPLPI